MVEIVLKPMAPTRGLSSKGWGFFMDLSPGQAGRFEMSGPVGSGTDTMFGLLGWMGKNGWHIKKADESIEISPNDKQYHDLVIGQKTELEGRIKQGLAQAATAVADYELLLHDERKIREFLDYFQDVKKAEKNYEETKKLVGEGKKPEADLKKAKKALLNAELKTKAIFIDQVDIHNGNSAILQIVSRWPTLVVDFQSITKYDLDPGMGENENADLIKNALGVSKAEGLVLAVKQGLYEEWKKLFLENLTSRYERIKQLVKGREKSVQQYREWIKPYIARHKLINEAFSNPQDAAAWSQVPYWTSGTAMAKQNMTIWAWKKLPMQPEFRKVSTQRIKGEFAIDPFDKAVWPVIFGGGDKDKDGKYEYSGYAVIKDKNKFYFKLNDDGKPIRLNGKNKSLIDAYQGLTPEMISDWINSIKNDSADKRDDPSKFKADDKNWGPLDPEHMYYTFMEINVERYIMKAPSWQSESGVFTIKNHFISQNFLLVKLLELKGEEWNFQNHVNEILGFQAKDDNGNFVDINQILKRDYPALFGDPDKIGRKESSSNEKLSLKQKFIDPLTQPFKDTFSVVGSEIKSFLELFGINYNWHRGNEGPYDMFKDRVTSVFLGACGAEWGAVSGQLKSMIGI